MNFTIGVGLDVQGRVRVEKWSKDGILEVREFPNVILNIGWDEIESRFMTNPLYPRFLYLGTGTAEPKATDIGLVNISPALGSKYRTSETLNGNQTQKRADVQLRFDYGEGEAAGTWTELGLGYWDGSGTESTRGSLNAYVKPLNRALFRDEGGVAQAITVLADEYLRIFVTLEMFAIFDDDQLFNWNFNGEPVTSYIKPSSAAVYTGQGFGSGNLWTNFPRTTNYARFTNKPGSAIGSGTGYLSISTDAENLTVSAVFDKNVVGAAWSIREIYWKVNANRTFIAIAHNFQRPGFLEGLIASEDTEKMTGSWGIQFFRACRAGTEGTASGGTVNTLTDASKNWDENEFQYKRVRIVSGTGASQVGRITSNTANTITVEADWAVIPDATSVYEVCLNG